MRFYGRLELTRSSFLIASTKNYIGTPTFLIASCSSQLVWKLVETWPGLFVHSAEDMYDVLLMIRAPRLIDAWYKLATWISQIEVVS